jgi:cysteine desulfurase
MKSNKSSKILSEFDGKKVAFSAPTAKKHIISVEFNKKESFNTKKEDIPAHSKDSKDSKNSKDSKDSKDTKDSKDSKDTKDDSPKLVYLDNNATTMMNKDTILEWVKWTNKGNPSASYSSAKECRQNILKFKEYLAKLCNFKLDDNEICSDDDNAYRVIFTSCATESNNTIIRSICEAYEIASEVMPHIILSAIEHKSSIECATHLRDIGRIQLTLVKPTEFGFVKPEDVKTAIQENTCLISIMHANNEIGSINNIQAIGKIAHDNNIPFHTDVAQTFGKFPIKPIESNVDAFSISFHKIYGPPGVGALIIKSKLMKGYRLCACISGTQNYNFRGGTENTPGLAASFKALTIAMTDRTTKNSRLSDIKRTFIRQLSNRVPCRTYTEYLQDKPSHSLEIIVLSPYDINYLASTIFISVVKHVKQGKPICNSELKHKLELAGYIVSIGSACNTDSKNASHVIYALGLDDKMKKGALRITLSDDTNPTDINDLPLTIAKILKEYA